MLIDDTLMAFGMATGLGRLELSDDAPLQLSLSEHEELVFERCPDGVLLHMDIRVRYDVSEVLASAMRRVRTDGAEAFHLQVGLRETLDDAWLVVATRASEQDFTVGWIDQAIAWLQQWVEELRRHFPNSFEGPLR